MKQEPQLIDLFAVFAMQSLTRNPSEPDELWVDYCQGTALEAYMMADAMMKERENWIRHE
jgi:hypothetical protein